MRQEEKSLLSRNKILEASGALFAEKGFDATTITQEDVDTYGI